MENNDIDAVYNLMQKLVDSNTDILNKLQSNVKDNQDEFIEKLAEKLDAIIHYLSTDHEKLISTIDRIKTPTKQYMLFGKDSPLNTRFLFILVSLVFIFWYGFKYVSPEIVNSKRAAIELQSHRIMMDYLFLKEYEKGRKSNRFLELYQRIEQNDQNVFKDYMLLKTKHEKEMKIQELNNQIKSLK